MRILAITYCFVPLRYPQTFCLLKWFKYFAETNHRVTVLSVAPESFAGPKDPELYGLVPPGVENITARSRENDLFYRVLGRAKRLLYPLFQPFKKPWYGPAKRVLHTLPWKDYDVILTCSQPPICHVLGLEAQRLSGLPWVASFSDPWNYNPYHRGVPPAIDRYNRALESRVVRRCDRITFPTQEICDLVMSHHASQEHVKSDVLPHCFVPEWFGMRRHAAAERSAAPVVLLTGSFYGPRSAIPFLQHLEKLGGAARFGGRLAFHFYGGMSEQDQVHPVWESARDYVRFFGSVGYLDSLALMRNADYLLLIDAPTAEGSPSIFFPLKLAEYIGSGRPIVGITPINGASARILRETNNPVVDPNDLAGLDDILHRISGECAVVQSDSPERNQYDYRTVGKRLLEILQKATREQSSRPRSRACSQ